MTSTLDKNSLLPLKTALMVAIKSAQQGKYVPPSSMVGAEGVF